MYLELFIIYYVTSFIVWCLNDLGENRELKIKDMMVNLLLSFIGFIIPICVIIAINKYYGDKVIFRLK